MDDEKKTQRQALMRAQELMKLTELPEGVELHSDVDEDASHYREEVVHEFSHSNFLPPK